MFDIGWSELLVIAVVALIFIGPKELPAVLRNIGQWTGKIRRMASEFQSQFQEAMREAEMEDLKKHADDLNNAARALSKPFDPVGLPRQARHAGHRPVSGRASRGCGGCGGQAGSWRSKPGSRPAGGTAGPRAAGC